MYGDSLALVLDRDPLLLGVLQFSVRLLLLVLLLKGKEALDVAWYRESWSPLYSVSLQTETEIPCGTFTVRLLMFYICMS